MKVRSALLAIILLSLVSCQPTIHPNQISDFDGKTYDSLLLAHGALVGLRENIRTQQRQYIAVFNVAAKSYNVAFNAYSVYRQAPLTGATEASRLVGNLALSINALERELTHPLPVEPEKVQAIRAKAQIRAAKMMQNRPRYALSLADILTALQTAAQIANAVPGASPYSGLALLIINATQSALNMSHASSGQPIELSLIAPVAAIEL